MGCEGVEKGGGNSVCVDAMVMWPTAPLRRPQSKAIGWVKDKGLEGFRYNQCCRLPTLAELLDLKLVELVLSQSFNMLHRRLA